MTYSAGRTLVVFGRLAVFVLATLVSACAAGAPEPIAIALVIDDSGGPYVRVSGLSSGEAAALSNAAPDNTAWQGLLRITTGGNDGPAVAGRYRVAGTFIEFEPAFPFEPGRGYLVEFAPARLPTPRADGVVATTVALPGRAPTAPVRVIAVYPSAGEWPENLLRFYVHFSGPMARDTGAGRIQLIDDTGRAVTDALLPASADFWSPDQRRYTVLFDPGRVKRGILPNLEQGRALVQGRQYTITIDADWRDAEGRPLAEEYLRTFTVGAPRESALSLDDWRISSPRAGSRDAVEIVVPAPLDHALFARTVGVASADGPLDGRVDITDSDTRWRFVPAQAWQRGPYDLVVLSALEDPAGNRIGRAFEVLPSDPAANVDLPERFTRPVTVQ